MQSRIFLLIAAGFSLVLLLFIANQRTSETLFFGGGPQGGTFIKFAEGIVALLTAETAEFAIKATSSGGSVDNLKAVNSGKAAIALVYAGDAYLGRIGELENEPARYNKVRALGRIYGSPAQLVVRQESIIKGPHDLVSRRVAIGSTGSGAAHSAERYFRALGIWDQIIPLYIGYSLGMRELSAGHAEAVWQLVGAPSPSIVNLSSKQPLRLINLSRAARTTDFYARYPFYTETEIPAQTYLGQEHPVETFQDNSLLVTHTEADSELLLTTLKLVYSSDGIRSLRNVHPAAEDLTSGKGLQGINIPLHPVAETYWKKVNVLK